jgi:hypothetical protein
MNVLDFNEANLAQALKLDSESEKRHYNYFKDYLGNRPLGIGAATIVIEDGYVSKAYLSDYAAYYSSCFQDYDRFCRRLHFFDKKMGIRKIKNEILKPESEYLNKHYLGYIVVKSIPDTVIGTTILRNYDKEEDGVERHYTSCRSYSVNFFGKELTIDSLAYQEQDTVVSACASTAVWSAFHKTSPLFQTSLPSPSEITKSAGNLYFNNGRNFPNSGLDITQIGKSIEAVDLVSEIRTDANYGFDIDYIRRFIYSYNKCGIPVLIFAKILDDEEEGEHHLFTVTGYSGKKEIPDKNDEISLVADQIQKFYVHDDQVGPFCRLLFEDGKMITSWTDKDSGDYLEAKVFSLIVPVYPKIRISFDDILTKTEYIDALFYNTDFSDDELIWDIYLTDSNTYKKDFLISQFDDDSKQKIALSTLPKYIWVARSSILEKDVFEFIFDATDISRGHNCLGFNVFKSTETSFKRTLHDFFIACEDYFLSKESLFFKKSLFDKILKDLSN